jgi:hypothetical protein
MTQVTAQVSADQKKSVAATVATKTWQYFGPFASPEAAAQFANLPPAQGSGEACFSVRESGETDAFLYL